MGVLMVALSASCGEGFWDAEEIDAFERLDASFSEPALQTGDAHEGELFRQLLGTKAGRAKVRQLDNEHDAIAYDEDSATVYFVHPRLGSGGRSCLGTVAFEHRGGGALVAHAGVPGLLELTGVRLQGGELTVQVAVSAAPEDSRPAELLGLAPGGTYDRSVPLERIAGRPLTLEDLGLDVPVLR